MLRRRNSSSSLFIREDRANSCLPSAASLQVRITVDELQIEFELIDSPIRIQFSEMEVIASDKGPRVPGRFARKIMIGDSVAVRRGFLALDRDGIIPRLVVNGFQRFQPLIPGVHDLLGCHRRGRPARHGGHIEQDFIRKASFDLAQSRLSVPTNRSLITPMI